MKPSPADPNSAPVADPFETIVGMLADVAHHAPRRVALEATCRVDLSARTIFIDITTGAGRDMALVFGGYVEKDFGPAVHLCRLQRRGA